MNIPFKLLRAGQRSLHLAIPAVFWRANELKPGDYLILEKVKIIRAEEMQQLYEETASEPVAMAAE